MNYTCFLPFKYRPCRIECDNTVVSNSAGEINRLRSKGALTSLDFEILKAISVFRYLNKHNLMCYLQADPTVSGAEREETLKNRLSKLTKNGLVLRHYFLPLGDEKTDAPHFYMLSRGAAAYIKRTGMSDFSVEEVLTLESSERVLLQLAFNQAAIQTLVKAPGALLRLNQPAKAPNHKEKFTVYGHVTVTQGDSRVPILYEPVRRFPTWERYIQKRAHLLSDYLTISKNLKKSGFQDPPLVVLVCEDDTHVQECYQLLRTDPLAPVYTTDARLMNEDLSSSFVGCREEGESVALVRYKSAFGDSSCQSATL